MKEDIIRVVNAVLEAKDQGFKQDQLKWLQNYLNQDEYKYIIEYFELYLTLSNVEISI